MTILLDTDVLIDCLRGVPAAGNWLAQSSTQPFQVPGIVGMELIAGCRDKMELQRIQQFLQSFTVVWPEPTEFAQAYMIFATHRLTTGLSIPDCLIAAMALARSARLYTFNVRHFRHIVGLDVQEPYSRP